MIQVLNTVMTLAAKLFMWSVELSIKLISAIVGSLWRSYQSQPRQAYQSPLKPRRQRRGKW